MTRFADITLAQTKEIEAVLAQSALLLQKNEPAGGQDGEGKSGGDLVEDYVRRFFRGLVPRGRYVTSGYLVDPEAFQANENLPQFDAIVADTSVPPLFSIIDGRIEIVPVESAIAVIEIKRTLTRTTVINAVGRLHKARLIFDRNNRAKNENVNTVVTGSLMPGTTSPMYGIVGLAYEDFDESVIDWEFVDFCWALQGFAAFSVGADGKVQPTVSRQPQTGSRSHKCVSEPVLITRQMMAVVRSWLATCTGTWLKPDRIFKYYGPA